MSTSVSKTRVTTALLVTIVSATSHAPVLHSSLDLDVKLVSGSVPILISSATAGVGGGGDQHCCFYSVCTAAGLIERL